MKSSSKRIISILLSLVFFVSAIFVYGNFIKSAYEKLQDKRSEVEARRDLRDQHEIAINQVQQLIQKFKGLSQLQSALSLTLPIGQDIPSLMAQLNGMAQSSDLVLQSLSFSDLPFRPPVVSLARELGVIQIQVRLNGSYEGVKRFLNNLETNVRIIDTKDVRVEPVPGKVPNLFNITLVAETYYQPVVQ